MDEFVPFFYQILQYSNNCPPGGGGASLDMGAYQTFSDLPGHLFETGV